MVNNLSTVFSLQISPIWGIKNEELEVVETSPNPSPSFLKKLPNKVIKLLSLLTPLPSLFFNFQNGHQSLGPKTLIYNWNCMAPHVQAWINWYTGQNSQTLQPWAWSYSWIDGLYTLMSFTKDEWRRNNIPCSLRWTLVINHNAQIDNVHNFFWKSSIIW